LYGRQYSNLVNESTDPESKLISDEKWGNLMGFNESDESNEFEFRCNENLDSHDKVPETDMPIYPGHRMTVNMFLRGDSTTLAEYLLNM
jgi:hypothetical protein